MLTDREIKKYVAEGKIRISPFEEKFVEPGNYRLRLGDKVLKLKDNQRTDLKPESLSNLKYDEFSLKESSYVLKPGEFILGQTYEQVGIDKDFVAILDGRSTLARLGITMHITAQYIDPGQKSHIIVLEIFNASNIEVELSYLDGVAKLIFFKFSEENERGYDDFGQYAGQQSTVGAIL